MGLERITAAIMTYRRIHAGRASKYDAQCNMTAILSRLISRGQGAVMSALAEVQKCRET